MKTQTKHLYRSLGFLATLASTSLLCSVQALASNACVHVAGQNFTPAQIYDVRHNCGTCDGQAAEPELCGMLNKIMVPDWDSSSDLQLIPHRGLWGQTDAAFRPRVNRTDKRLHMGAPENTMSSITIAFNAGYRIVEIDVLLVVDKMNQGKPSSADRRYHANHRYHKFIVNDMITRDLTNDSYHVFLGHYFDIKAYNYNRNDATTSTPPPGLNDYGVPDVLKLKMNYRNQTSYNETYYNDTYGDIYNEQVTKLEDALKYAKANQMMLTIDPKSPEPPWRPYEEAIIVATTLNNAKALGALQNITIKTKMDYLQLIAEMDHYKLLDHPYSEYEGQFLWSPIINDKVDVTFETVKEKVANWIGHTAFAKQVLTFELAVFSPKHWTANPLIVNSQRGRPSSYKNVLHWLKTRTEFSNKRHAPLDFNLSYVGKRVALWSIDPMGDKGTLSRLYKWKFIGNTDDDKRGNVVTNLSYELARHTAMITDRPNVYKDLIAQHPNPSKH